MWNIVYLNGEIQPAKTHLNFPTTKHPRSITFHFKRGFHFKGFETSQNLVDFELKYYEKENYKLLKLIKFFK